MSLKDSSMVEPSEGTLGPRGECGSLLTDLRKKEAFIAVVYSQTVSDSWAASREVGEGILGRNVVLEGRGGVNEEEYTCHTGGISFTGSSLMLPRNLVALHLSFIGCVRQCLSLFGI